MDGNNVVEYVKKQKNMILEQLDSVKSTDDESEKKKMIDEMYLKTEDVRKYVHQYLPNMIAFDIRTCNEMIKEMENRIKNERSSISSKKSFKFLFGGGGTNNNNNFSKQQSKPTNFDETDSMIQKSTPPSSPVAGDTIESSSMNNIDRFHNLCNQTFELNRDQTDGKQIVLDTLVDCQVRIRGVPTSVRLINLKNCTVCTDPISSSAYIDRCVKCRFSIIAQQVRIHETRDCDFYLHVSSRTIIEDSTNLRFDRYDCTYAKLEDDYKKAGIDPNQKNNNWNQIDDFNCLGQPSPNWSLMS